MESLGWKENPIDHVVVYLSSVSIYMREIKKKPLKSGKVT